MPKRSAPFPCSVDLCGENFAVCGKASTYGKRKCRCERCSTAASEARRDYYQRHRETELTQANRYNEEHRDERREYDRQYKAANREILAERVRNRYWEDPETNRERVRNKRAQDPEAHRQYKSQWRLRNHQRELERERKYHDANREKRNAASRMYAKANPERGRRAARERRVRLQNLDVLKVTNREWNRILERFRHRCYYCEGQGEMTMDHIIAITRGGRHSIGNLIPACRSCNSSKSDKTIMEWRMGRVSPARARRRKSVA